MLLLSRMALVALVIGTSVTVAATERIEASLVISGMLCWSFVPVLQLLTGLVLLRGTRGKRGDRLERYFATHWPWSLWILALHAALLMVPPARGYVYWLAVTAVIPVIATVKLLLVYCSETLALPAPEARVRILQHQLLTLTLAILAFQLAVALWPRLLGTVA